MFQASSGLSYAVGRLLQAYGGGNAPTKDWYTPPEDWYTQSKDWYAPPEQLAHLAGALAHLGPERLVHLAGALVHLAGALVHLAGALVPTYRKRWNHSTKRRCNPTEHCNRSRFQWDASFRVTSCQPAESAKLAATLGGLICGEAAELPVEAIRTNAVAEVRAGLVVNVGFHLLPVVAVVAHALAVHADRDEFLELAEFPW
jgi:hypothetical protein